MGNRIFDHRIIGVVQPFIQQVIEGGRCFTDRVEWIVEEFIHHQHRAITDLRRPVLDMLHKGPDHFLRPHDLIQIAVWFTEKFPQPLTSPDCPGKIQFMEYGEFFFRMEDGDVVEGCVVDLHISKVRTKNRRCQEAKEGSNYKWPIINKLFSVLYFRFWELYYLCTKIQIRVDVSGFTFLFQDGCENQYKFSGFLSESSSFFLC